MAREILLRLRYPNRQAERVALLVREHNWHYLPEWNDATVRRTIARIGPDALPDLWALRRADLQARGRLVAEGLANQQQVEARFEAELHRAAALRVTDLAIGGEEVMAVTGIAPGKRVGEILTGLLDRVLDDPDLNTREALMRLASEMARTPSTGNPQQ
jgi:hypothetical protein